MTQYDLIQLGSVTLPAIANSTLPLSSWAPLTSATLDNLTSSLPTSRLTFELISKALSDPGLGFQAEICNKRTSLKIRCRVTPSDSQGSIWKRLSWKGRDTVVKGLLKTLERVWEYDDVSEGVLMSLTVGLQLSSLPVHWKADNHAGRRKTIKICRISMPQCRLLKIHCLERPWTPWTKNFMIACPTTRTLVAY